MPSMPYDDDCVYGSVPMPYRNPESCVTMPDFETDSNQARNKIPQRPGFGTLNPSNIAPQVTVPCKVLNGRLLEQAGESPSFDQHSFMFARQQLQFRGDWEDIADVRDHYLPEVEALVRQQVPGADHPDAHVLIFDHTIRTHTTRGRVDAKAANAEHGWGGYANNAHTDATVRSLHSRCKDQILGTNETVVKYQGEYPACWRDVRPTLEWQQKLFRAEEADHDSPIGTGGEHMIVNVWRPIQETPVLNWSLAALDGSTLRQGDVHPTTIVKFNNKPGGRTGGAVTEHDSQVYDINGDPVPFRTGETTTPLHEDSHRWVFYPEMTRDEVLLLKVFDSRRDGRTRCGCHCAFKDPLTADPKAFRESIETRCLVILPKGIDDTPSFTLMDQAKL